MNFSVDYVTGRRTCFLWKVHVDMRNVSPQDWTDDLKVTPHATLEEDWYVTAIDYTRPN